MDPLHAAVGQGELVGVADAALPVDPAVTQAGVLHRLDPALQGRLGHGPPPREAHPRMVAVGDLERVVVRVVPAAQEHRVATAAGLDHAEQVLEEPQGAVDVR